MKKMRKRIQKVRVRHKRRKQKRSEIKRINGLIRALEPLLKRASPDTTRNFKSQKDLLLWKLPAHKSSVAGSGSWRYYICSYGILRYETDTNFHPPVPIGTFTKQTPLEVLVDWRKRLEALHRRLDPSHAPTPAK